MLKVCGITYDHTINYGSCLQAYALQKVIDSIKVGNHDSCLYELIPLWTCKDYPKKRLKNFMGLQLLQFYHRSFAGFEKKYMRYAKCNSIATLDSFNGDTDAFVCGSDVIWNPYHNKGVSAYYLDFAKKYAFSYAASFGSTSLDDAKKREISQHLSKLNCIGVREKSALQLIYDLTGKEGRIVVDPTFLLSEDEWSDIAPKQSTKQYIFVYTTHMNDNIKTMIDRVKERTGQKVIIAEWDSSPSVLVKRGITKIYSPEEWLQLLHNAEYVVTNSFHATAFSVLFHKTFFTVVNGDKAKGINVRMNDFLNTVGLGNRIISEVPDQLDLSEIDFTNADKKIEEMRKESYQFLQENLEAAYREKVKREQSD